MSYNFFSAINPLEQVIITNPLIVSPHQQVLEVLLLMSTQQANCWVDDHIINTNFFLNPRINNTNCALVVEDNILIGILTHRDIVRLSAESTSLVGVTIGEVMITPVITMNISECTDIFMIINCLNQNNIRHLPLVNNYGGVVGLVTHNRLNHTIRAMDLLRLRQIEEVMTKDVVHTPSNIKLLQVVELMVKHKISSVVITQAQENSGLNSKLIPIGIITEKDIVQFKTIELDLATIDAKRVMSTPLFSLSIEDSLLSVSFLMQQRKISHVVITNDQGELAGIITNSNMLKIMNPLEIYQLVNSLEKKINALESEKVELLAKRNLQLEQEVEKRTQELYNQTQQERLLADISDRIRASLNLEEILNISVKEVRKLLNCDRVLVEQYQLNHRGVIAAEAIIDHQIESLENKIEYSYFYHKFSSNSYPQQGIIIPNIYKYDYPNNYLKVLERYQIKSKLIVPIIVENNLWGLLIAHQCNSYREWEKLNLETMERLGVQLAIAIQQANAYETSQIQLQERQKAEIALQENEELFRNTFEQAAVGMIHIDLDRRFLRVNQCFCDIVGYSMAELLTLTVPEITHPEDKIHGWDLREKLFTGEIQNFTREKRYIRTDGLTVWANVTVTLLRSPNGEPKYFIAIVEDITARKAAQASLKLLNQELEKRVEERTLDLQQSEKRFRTLFTLAPDCIYVVNFAGIIQQVNRAVLEKSGYTEAELIGRKLQSFLSIQSQQIYEQNFHNFLETGNDDKEIEFYFKNGEMRIMNSSATIIYNDEHQPDYILILHKDITSRKQSEKQLLEISQLQTAILDGIDYSIISTDRNGMIQTFNAAAQEMLGYTPAEVIGRYTTELIHDQEEITQHAITLSAELGTSIAPGFDVFIAKARQGIISESEWTYIRKDGSKFPVLLSVSALWDQQNNITGFIGLAKDITLQKQAEQEKQLLEQRLQFLLAYSPAVIYSCAATPNYGVTFIGDNVYTMLGYQPQEFLADEKFWVERIHPDDQSQIISDLGSLFELGYHTHEYRFLHQNGEYYWLRDDLRLVRDDLGNPIEIIGCLININDRKNIENDLQERNNELAIANNNLERATKLKDEFLANMSHELRTPLNTILGMSKALQDNAFGEINPQQRRSLQTVERSGKNLLDLINDIIDLSKIEAGKLELHLNLISVFELCQSSLTFINQQARQKNLQIELNIAQGIKEIIVDERYMRQVLINLLSNAIKFTPENGKIQLNVSLETQELENNNEHSHILFSVIDTGIGIAPENINKLFHSFVQIDNRLNRQYAGTGLGLALVRKIVELHGVSISVDSQLGQGSCFTVKLLYLSNFPENLTNSLNTHSSILPTHYKRAAFIIQDSYTTNKQLTRYLKKIGIKYAIYSQGEGAIIEAKHIRPSLIFLSSHLPDISAWELLQELKADVETKSIPIIVIGMENEELHAISLGATSFLCKPIHYEQISATIETIFSLVSSTSVNLTRSNPQPNSSSLSVTNFLILLVEDNEANISTISDYLMSRGYEILVARNALEGINLAKAYKPQSILINMQIPGMDGIEATRQIRADESLADTPIFAITALPVVEDKEKCLAIGINEYISKPLRLKHLVDTIQQYLVK